MQVKDLIAALEQCDQEAEVLTEAWASNNVKVVAKYNDKTDTFKQVVVIGDDLTYVDDEMLPMYHKFVVSN